MQVFPSEASLERLVGAVHLERSREWDERRYISGERMGDLYDRPIPEPAPDAGAEERARRALEASLELAEELAAA